MPASFTRLRSDRKKQTKLAFDPVGISSSAAMSPARITLQTLGSHNKVFDFSSSARTADGIENQAHLSGKALVVVPQTPKKGKRDGRLPFKPLATPAASSEPESGDENCKDRLRATDLESSIEPAQSSPHLVDLSERLSLSPFKIPISPEHSDPIYWSTAAPGFKSALKRRRGLGYDGADDEGSADFPLYDEESARDEPRTTRTRSQTRVSRAITISDTEMEDTAENPTQTRVERGRSRIPVDSLDDSPNRPQRRNMGARRFISGGTTYNSPATRSPWKKSRRPSMTAGPSPKRSKDSYERVITLSDYEDDSIADQTRHQTRSTVARKRENASLGAVQRSGSNHRGKQEPSRWAVTDSSEKSDDDDDDDDLPEISSILSRTGRKYGAAVRNTSTMQLSQDIEGDDELDDDPVVSSPMKRQRKIVDDDDQDDDPVVSSPMKRRKSMFIEIDSESEVDASSGRRRRLHRTSTRQTAVKESGPRHQVDLESDDEQLRRLNRTRLPKKARTLKEKRLEYLRRRKAGEQVGDLSPLETDDDDQRQPLYDSDSELEALSDFEDEEVIEQEGRRPRRDEKDGSDDDDDDFVVADDDEDALGVPHDGLYGIPLEFTKHAHKHRREHFKDAIEWMVQNKINPAFSQNDQIYVNAFRKLGDEVSGLVNSKFMSSSWSKSFILSLKARPNFSIEDVGAFEDTAGRKCDACGRSNHNARYVMQFSGKAYHNSTLEEVEADTDSSSEDSSVVSANSKISTNSKGYEIPSQETRWYVGSHCRANAETAHSLLHWKYKLNLGVTGFLHTDGHLDPDKLAERVDWSQKKRRQYANSIIDEWHGENSAAGPGGKGTRLANLFQEFKTKIQLAKDKKTGRWDAK